MSLKTLLGVAALMIAASAPFVRADVAYMEFDGPVIERDPSASPLFADPDKRTLRQVIASIEDLRGRPDIDGLVLRLKHGFSMSATQVDEMGAALDALSDSGVRVHVFAESYGPLEVLVASYCDEVLMQKGGGFSSPRIYIEEMFLADALGKLGMEPSFVQVGKYKGAEEMLANASPSDAWEENISGLLDAMYAGLTNRIGTGFDLDRSEVRRALRETFWADGDAAKKVGMLDEELDFLDLRAHLEGTYGEGFRYRRDVWAGRGIETPDFARMNPLQAISTLMRLLSDEGADRETTRDTIALLYLDGAIVDGESSRGGLFGGASVGSVTMRKALAEIENDRNIKGVVVRIDSPGGSAIASEVIWQGVRRVASAGKPVWVSVGSMAASGGYYVAVAGDRIYVTPGSVVGSIGVVGGKVAMGGLYDKLGVNVVPRSRGPRAELMSSVAAWDEEQRDVIRELMTDTYELFVERVTQGREGIEIDRTAEGRLFLGTQAIERGMADKLGGVDVALDDMAGELGLREGAYDVMEFPAPLTFEEMFAGFPFASAGHERGGRTPEVALVLREVLGERAWEKVGDASRALLELRDHPVVLTSPRVLIER